MTIKNSAHLVGKSSIYKVKSLSFPVRIIDIRNAFGRVDALIEPLAGEGSLWVDVRSLKLRTGTKHGTS